MTVKPFESQLFWPVIWKERCQEGEMILQPNYLLIFEQANKFINVLRISTIS